MTHSVRRIEDYYAFVFSFPGVKKLIIYVILTHLIKSFFVVISDPSSAPKAVMIFTYYDSSMTLLALLASSLLNLKRALGLTCVVDVMTTIIFSFISLLEISTGIDLFTSIDHLLSSYAISYCLLHLVVRAFTDNAKAILLLVLFYSIPILTLHAQVTILLIELLVSLVISEVAVRLIDSRGDSIIGVSGIDIFKAFMKLLLLNNNEHMESILKSKLSKEEQVKVTVIVFKKISDSKVKAALIIPRVHPGPFRNVGSSALPSILIDSLDRCGINAIVLHGASTHNLDMVSSEEVSTLVSEICYCVTNYNKLSLTDVSCPLVKESEKYRCIGQRFGKYLLVVVSRKGQGMEDIPECLEIDVNSYFKEREYEVIVVDAHNSIDYEGVNVSLARNSEDYRELVKLVVEIAEELCQQRGHNIVEVGAHRLRSKYNPRMGLGEGGVASLVIKVSSTRLSFLVFDANNMVLGLRDQLMKELKNKGLPVAEVLTTDNHAIAGALPRVKYYPLGLKIGVNELLRMSKCVLINSLKDVECVEVLTGTVKMRVRVLGEESFKKIRAFILTSVKIIKIALLAIPLMSLIHVLVTLLT